MLLPCWCDHCSKLNMVDYENLESRPLPKLWSVAGFECEQCHLWKPLFYYNARLLTKLHKLCGTRQKKFKHKFQEAFRSARAAQLVGQENYGSSIHSDMAST